MDVLEDSAAESESDYVPEGSDAEPESDVTEVESTDSEEAGVAGPAVEETETEEEELEEERHEAEAAGLPEWIEYEGNSLDFDFDEDPGLSVEVEPSDGNAVRPIDVFRLFVTDTVIDLMVRETNRFAQDYINQNCPLRRRSRLNAWKDIDSADMWEFLSIIQYMGVQANSPVSDYWSSKFTTSSFSEYRTGRDQFQLMFRFWHLSDNAELDPQQKLGKVQPLLDLLFENVQSSVVLGESVTVDESMIPFRGRLSIRQYIPGKRHKFGVKMYKFCEPNGFTYDAFLYGGRSQPLQGLSTAESVVAKLCEKIVGSGRRVYADNFVTGIPLANYLLDRDLHLTGTFRKNRRYVPKAVVNARLQKGEVVSKGNARGIVVCKWKDKRDVLTLSTIHAPTMVNSGRLDRQGNPVQKPEIVVRYNGAKIGIDLSDQLSSYQTTLRRTLFWCKKIALEVLFGVALINAYVLYRKDFLDPARRKVCTVYAFKKQLLEQCFQIATQQRVAADQPTTSKRQKVARGLVPEGHKLVESPRREGQRGAKETRRRCSGCYRKLMEQLQDRKQAGNRARKVLTYCPGCNGKYYCSACFFENPVHIAP